jgi:hypothetical protein
MTTKQEHITTYIRFFSILIFILAVICIFFLGAKKVLADCAPGYFCSEQTVVDIINKCGCRGFNCAYCAIDDYRQIDVYCDSDCGRWYDSPECGAVKTDITGKRYCPTYGGNLDWTNCCELESGDPDDPGGPTDQAPKGYHDGESGTSETCRMFGWTCDPDNWSSKLDVHLYEGATPVGYTTANVSNEPAVTAACGGDAGHRFEFNFAESSPIWDGNPHTITAYALGVDGSGNTNGNNPELSGTPKTITCPIDTTPPTCTISGLTGVNINTDATYVATGSDPNLTEVEIFKSPTEDRSWTNVVDGCAGPVCQGTTQFSSEGTYYVTCTAYDSAGNKCSGNPWCVEFPPVVTPEIDCPGWSDCTTSDLLTVTVTRPGPWWQVEDADVISQNGDIISSIPLSCALPDCNPLFGLKGLGGFPGVPIYGGSTADFGEGGISSTDWLANTETLFSKIYDYDFFRKMVRTDVENALTEIEQASVNGGFFTSGGTPKRGYVWYHFDGDAFPPGNLTINSNINMQGDRKVVVLVENADLHIDGRINVEKGEGFIMFIVGKDDSGNKGNIYVDADVSHPSQVEIEGVFMSEGQFKTGAGDKQLYIRGMVAAYGGIVLERDLLDDNANEPAEVFEFAPDFILNFPRDLTFKRLNWKEVAP